MEQRVARLENVAQTVCLLYRRLTVGSRSISTQVINLRYSRLPVCATNYARRSFIADQMSATTFALRLGAEVAFAMQPDGNVPRFPVAAAAGSMVWTFDRSVSAIFAPARDLSELTGSVPGQFCSGQSWRALFQNEPWWAA
jgi:hypothetical protein